jgi:hypothetical protein
MLCDGRGTPHPPRGGTRRHSADRGSALCKSRYPGPSQPDPMGLSRAHCPPTAALRLLNTNNNNSHERIQQQPFILIIIIIIVIITIIIIVIIIPSTYYYHNY